MTNEEMMASVGYWGHKVLEWVGFGTLTGLLAKAIMPGKDPGGAVATLCMGVGGTVIGCGVVTYFYPGANLGDPLTPLGFGVGTLGAFTILFFYKLLGGYYNLESDSGGGGKRRVVRAAPSKRRAVVYEDE